MSFDSSYRCDREFLKLLTRRSEIDLVGVALEIARDADPTCDPAFVQTWIEDRAREIRSAVACADSEAEALAALGAGIHQSFGLTGGCAAFDSADGSYLHSVIRNQTGVPLSVSLLYMAVAARVGLDLHGVAAPRHFLTRYESAQGPLFLDAYHGGRVLSEPECMRFLGGVTDLPEEYLVAELQPADPRTIVIRMLNNLKAIHLRREEWSAAWHVQHRLVSLQPAAYAERRDLAFLAIRAGRPGCAIDLLKCCMATAPPEEQSALQSQLETAQSQLCRMN